MSRLTPTAKARRKAPLAVEAVRRIDAIFTIEREINGTTAEQRLAIRKERVRPLVGELEEWMRAAAMYTLIATAKLNRVDPQAWLADVLRRIADHPTSALHELLPWHWKHRETPAAAA